MRWSARRSLAFMVSVSLAFWVGIVFAVLFLIHADARDNPPRAWEQINAQVNTLDRRTAPLAAEGDDDGVFDCEDYAWTKYHALASSGVSPSDLRMYAVTVANGSRHMILVAKGWVFDSLEPRLEPEAKARRYYRDWEDRTNPRAVIVIR